MKKKEKRKLKMDYIFIENKPQLELAFRCLVENFYKNQKKLKKIENYEKYEEQSSIQSR